MIEESYKPKFYFENNTNKEGSQSIIRNLLEIPQNFFLKYLLLMNLRILIKYATYVVHLLVINSIWKDNMKKMIKMKQAKINMDFPI